MSVKNLLYCMLVRSGNDAANVLAMHIGGSMEGFVKMMNDKAAALGCKIRISPTPTDSTTRTTTPPRAI